MDRCHNLPEPISPNRFLSFTVARVPLRQVDREVEAVLSRIAKDRFRRYTPGQRLPELYDIEPPPGGAHLYRVTIHAPKNCAGASVIRTNVADGWSSLSYLVAREHESYQMQIISTRADVEYPQNRIEIWNNGESKRVVMAMRDSDRWEFVQDGIPENFEDLTLYTNRIKRKRLDRAVLVKYAQRAGFEIAQSGFWRSDAKVVCFDEIRKR
jgi:hypothetical protein